MADEVATAARKAWLSSYWRTFWPFALGAAVVGPLADGWPPTRGAVRSAICFIGGYGVALALKRVVWKKDES
jgi:hypothetical protein